MKRQPSDDGTTCPVGYVTLRAVWRDAMQRLGNFKRANHRVRSAVSAGSLPLIGWDPDGNREKIKLPPDALDWQASNRGVPAFDLVLRRELKAQSTVPEESLERYLGLRLIVSEGDYNNALQELERDPGTRRSKGGAPAKYPWEQIKPLIFKRFDYEGTPDPGDPRWQTNVDVADAILQYLKKLNPDYDPAPSTLRKYAAKWIKEFSQSYKNMPDSGADN